MHSWCFINLEDVKRKQLGERSHWIILCIAQQRELIQRGQKLAVCEPSLSRPFVSREHQVDLVSAKPSREKPRTHAAHLGEGGVLDGRHCVLTSLALHLVHRIPHEDVLQSVSRRGGSVSVCHGNHREYPQLFRHDQLLAVALSFAP